MTITPKQFWHKNMCDASTGIAIGPNLFVVANDEDNILRMYYSDKDGDPIKEFYIGDYFKNNSNPTKKEADIEACACINTTIYWITSHARNKSGEVKLERQQFFATEIKVNSEGFSINQVGQSYTNLLADLSDDPKLAKYNLKQSATLKPEEPSGLNIEGLTVTGTGSLLIGFRNPIPDNKALLIPLENPSEMVTKGEKAKFGEPIELNIDGLGIRSIDYWQENDVYLIIAGPYNDAGKIKLYKWSGNPSEDPTLVKVELSDLNLEAIIIYPFSNNNIIQLLSDDGGRKNSEGVECKDLPKEQRRFRSWLIELTNI